MIPTDSISIPHDSQFIPGQIMTFYSMVVFFKFIRQVYLFCSFWTHFYFQIMRDLNQILVYIYSCKKIISNTLIFFYIYYINLQSTNTFLSEDMLTGLLAGFGFFIGLISLICICWCCCCGNGCSNSETDKRRVGPSPPPWRSRPNTRATTANTVSTRITTAPPSRRAQNKQDMTSQ